MTAADCWADLEAKARAVSPKRWSAFGGYDTNTFAVRCARTGREVIHWTGFDESRTADTRGKRDKLESYIAAANPATILKLIEAARHSQPGAEGGEGRDDFMDGCITGYVREAAKRVTGGNMTFADDDIRVLEVLAVRAVRAGLTDNLHPDVAATAVEACATHPLPDEASPQQPATSTDEKVGG